MTELEILRPDDWHIHLRDDVALERTVVDAAQHFGRVLAMPNLKPPVRTVDEQRAYHQRVAAHLDDTSLLQPLYALYLTDHTSVDDVAAAGASDQVLSFKLYPQGATTNSDTGVSHIDAIDDLFAAMAEHGVVLCVHAEVTDADVDIFDRERIFLERTLAPLLQRHPKLKCVVEHLTTKAGVDFVQSFADGRVAATITVHHLHINRNAIFQGGIRPHMYCLPIAKREGDRQALLGAAASGDSRFFFGSDSAPHARPNKESACGCAGIYTAPNALPLLAEAFVEADALDRLEGFTSKFGADFYNQPLPTTSVVLQDAPSDVGARLPFDGDDVVVFRDGQSDWRVL